MRYESESGDSYSSDSYSSDSESEDSECKSEDSECKSEDSDNAHYCYECQRSFTNQRALYQHNEAKHQTCYYCGACERDFVDEKALEQHNEAKHRFHCYECNLVTLHKSCQVKEKHQNSHWYTKAPQGRFFCSKKPELHYHNQLGCEKKFGDVFFSFLRSKIFLRPFFLLLFSNLSEKF